MNKGRFPRSPHRWLAAGHAGRACPARTGLLPVTGHPSHRASREREAGSPPAEASWGRLPRAGWPLFGHQGPRLPVSPPHSQRISSLPQGQDVGGRSAITSMFQGAEKRKRMWSHSLPFCFHSAAFLEAQPGLHVSSCTSRPRLRGPHLAAERSARVPFSAGCR